MHKTITCKLPDKAPDDSIEIDGITYIAPWAVVNMISGAIPHWTPVNIALPEILPRGLNGCAGAWSDDVLVYYYPDSNLEGDKSMTIGLLKSGEDGPSWDLMGCAPGVKVTHWMSLPKSPEEEAKDGIRVKVIRKSEDEAVLECTTLE